MTEVEWSNMTATELRELADTDCIVVVPVGSTEQHGPHLPVCVDALLAKEVAVRAARRASDQEPVVVTPTVWTGLAEHHMGFGGTFTLDFATFLSLLRCICKALGRHGFRRIFILNGHGGNMAALDVVATELGVELELPIAAGTYWMLAETAFAELLDRQSNVLHAGEAETSMLLALRPDLVRSNFLDAVAAPAGSNFWRNFMRAPSRWRSWTTITSSGVLGDLSPVSADKGEQLLAVAAEALADMLCDATLWN